MKKLFLIALVAAASAGAWQWDRARSSRAPDTRFRTVKVERGEVVEGVTASGQLEPLILVEVGSQVSGIVAKLEKDFNSPVAAGETIAQLETGRLTAQVEQDEAALDRAKADVDRVDAQIWQADRELDRQTMLRDRNVVSQSDLDGAIANTRLLRAQRAVAAAVVSQSAAALKSDLLNLRHATIRSPIDGVVISRHIDVGQTVAASLQAPKLFVIANDLSKIQIQANVPEAEIGRIAVGQKARFGFDTFPGRRFEGVVSQVRLAPVVVQNVVTYTVLIDAENADGKLLPGMTANVTFEIARSAKDALLVPVTATRYKPSPSLVEPSTEPAKEAKSEAKGHEIVAEASVPPAVVAARSKAYPSAKTTAWVKSGDAFEANLIDSGAKLEVEYAADGALVEVGEELTLDAAPDAIRSGVAALRFSKTQLRRLKRNTKPGRERATWKLVFRVDEGRGFKVELDDAGKLIKEKEIRGEELEWQAEPARASAKTPPKKPTTEKPKKEKASTPRVWVVAPSGLLRAVRVKLGITNGTLVAVEPLEKGALDEGQDVVVGIARAVEDLGTNPFGPPGGEAKKEKHEK